MEVTKRTYQKHKTEKKITINHELNTRVKHKKNSKGQDMFPIYVRIGFGGKNTFLSSRIKLESTIEEFDNLLITESLFVREEKKVIKSLILAFHAIDKDFNLNKWAELYPSYFIYAHEYLNQIFLDEFINLLQLENHLSKLSLEFINFIKEDTHSILPFMSFISDMGIKSCKDYIETIREIIDNYTKIPQSRISKYKSYEKYNNVYKFCALDIDSGFFQDYMSKNSSYFGDISMKKLNELKNKIGIKYEEY